MLQMAPRSDDDTPQTDENISQPNCTMNRTSSREVVSENKNQIEAPETPRNLGRSQLIIPPNSQPPTNIRTTRSGRVVKTPERFK